LRACYSRLPFASDQPRSWQPLKGDKQRTCIETENALAHLFERTAIRYPCMGSSASVFRMSMSRVPSTRSLGWSALDPFPMRIKRKNTPLLLIVKRRTTTALTSPATFLGTLRGTDHFQDGPAVTGRFRFCSSGQTTPKPSKPFSRAFYSSRRDALNYWSRRLQF
jgi:hypothetical protein